MNRRLLRDDSSLESQHPLYGLLQEMLSMEERVDETYHRLKTSIVARDFQPNWTKQVLTAQLHATIERKPESLSCWVVRLGGTVEGESKPVTAILRRVCTTFEGSAELAESSLEWERDDRSASQPETLEFHFEAPDSNPLRDLQLVLYPLRIAPRFRLPQELADLLGLRASTPVPRSEIFSQFQLYAQRESLVQGGPDRRWVQCDEPLRRLLGTDAVDMSVLPQVFAQLMIPCDSQTLDLSHLELPAPGGSKIYTQTVTFPVVDLTASSTLRLKEYIDIQNDRFSEELERLDRMAELVDLGKRLAENPVEALRATLLAQIRDEAFISDCPASLTDDAYANTLESERRADFYRSRYASRAVSSYLATVQSPHDMSEGEIANPTAM